jgi:tetratricopeptide (TPR) repeat protein
MKAAVNALLGCLLAAILAAGPAATAQTGTPAKPRIIHDPEADELNALLAAGQKALDQQDYTTAVKNFQDFLAKKPDSAAVHFELGYAYTALHKPDEARAEYQKAAELDPKMDAAYLNLGLTLLDTDPAAAIEPLRKASELKPDEARPKLLLGWAYERSKQLPDAIAQFQAAEKLDGKDFEIHFALARALLSANRAAEAEPEFRAALALKEDSAAAHLGLAQSLLAEKKLDAAEPELSAYLAEHPEDTQARVDHAAVLVDIGKYPEALAELDRAAAAGPESVRALKLRSEADFELKKYDDAMPVLQKAEAMDPKDPEIPARLGHLYLEKKEYSDALKYLTASYQMDPSSTDVLADLVAANYLGKNWTAALQAIDLLSKRKELPVGSIFIRATCYDRLGQTKLALDGYQEFLKLNKDLNSDMYFEAAARARTLARELEEKKR